jgi:hypothetical protein
VLGRIIRQEKDDFSHIILETKRRVTWLEWNEDKGKTGVWSKETLGMFVRIFALILNKLRHHWND